MDKLSTSTFTGAPSPQSGSGCGVPGGEHRNQEIVKHSFERIRSRRESESVVVSSEGWCIVVSVAQSRI